MGKIKLIVLITVIISCLFILSGCTNSDAGEIERFVKVGYTGDVILYYDNITKVQYISYNNRRGGTALTVLLDAEGKPLLYEGE